MFITLSMLAIAISLASFAFSIFLYRIGIFSKRRSYFTKRIFEFSELSKSMINKVDANNFSTQVFMLVTFFNTQLLSSEAIKKISANGSKKIHKIIEVRYFWKSKKNENIKMSLMQLGESLDKIVHLSKTGGKIKEGVYNHNFKASEINAEIKNFIHILGEVIIGTKKQIKNDL